ncbi:hypothetical protein CEP51_009667 [Fusarium floridanum]|uniref:Heterokaryon incompatibility domain-containing protein n=1 Tax=Fusarium floridanum TaxID=1325733 RepID=A0A428RGW8_9HYPO|nr:hypothetical protein CEP51_009667 [Fusarium floridanum]
METAASPLYKPLDPSTSEIRLLEVPSDGSEDWGLITVSLDGNPEYFALSYVWGEKTNLRKIVLQGQDREITPNLASALSRIQSGSLGETPVPVKYLWVDAICINQADNEERSQQVRFMHRIFKSAQVVFSWVGPEDHSLAFQTIKTLAQEIALNYIGITIPDDSNILEKTLFKGFPPFEFEWLQRHPSLCNETLGTEGEFGNDQWNAVRGLLLDKYWRRIWIFQEVVFARRLHLFSSGDITLDQQDLFMFMHSYHRLRSQPRFDWDQVPKPDFLCQKVWTGLVRYLPHNGMNKVLKAKAIALVSDRLKLHQGQGKRTLVSYNWAHAFIAERLNATDPKDYIYGLLAVSRLPIMPDYSKSVAQLYTEFVKLWIEAAKEARRADFTPLGFLSLAGVGYYGQSDNFPSWAPNFPKNALSNRRNLLPGAIWPNMLQEDPSNYPYLAENTGSLFVWGVEIEPVLHVSSFVAEGCLREQIFAIGNAFRRYTSRHQHHPPLACDQLFTFQRGMTSWDAISRLLFKRVLLVEKAMVCSMLALAAATSKYGKEYHPDDLGGWDSSDSFLFPNNWETQLYKLAFPYEDLKNLGFSDDPLADKESKEEELYEYVHSVTQVMRERSLFETEKGYLGRGPRNAQEGDVLCVLKDHARPVLLRKQGGHYTFVGNVAVSISIPEKFAQDNPSGFKWFELR